MFFEETQYLQVWHGEDYLSLGFLFGRKSRIAYVSDVSRFPIETEHGTVNLLHFISFSSSSVSILLSVCMIVLCFIS
jgi:hypothetical protein